MSTIANSVIADTLFGTNGSAITSQPNNKKTTLSGPGTLSTDSAVSRISTEVEASANSYDNDPVQSIAIQTTDTIRGTSNTAILGGATEPNRDVNNAVEIRGDGVASAIRAGYWHEYSGTWTTDPTAVNETAIIQPQVDSAYSGTGRVTYQYGAGSPGNANL